MKTVFILGAGASKKAGAPVMSDFLERAESLYHKKGIVGGPEAGHAFRDVLSAISELRGIYAKAYLDLDNIEVLFGAIEMAQVIGKFGQRTGNQISQLRESIVSLIVNTLESTVRFPVSNNRISPPAPYGEFIEMIIKLRETYGHQTVQNFSFITFNYDLALDYSLQYYGSHGLEYCLSDTPISNAYPYLKLHGSINWGLCGICQKIIPMYFNEVQFDLFYPELRHVFYDLGSRIPKKIHCGEPMGGSPVIVPPTWNKTAYHRDLGLVWRKASEELASAENIFVVGYSLPSTDLFFRYLFALGTDSTSQIKRFWVFDPDPSVEDNFRHFIGRSIENKFKFFTDQYGKFENAIDRIRVELEGI